MKIKIGNFNFINKGENKINAARSNRDELDLSYYYLDGKEDTLFINTNYYFCMENGYAEGEYEKNLKNKYKIIYVYEELKNQVNQYINDKIEQFFEHKNYSKYELYKDMDLRKFEELSNGNKFCVGYDDYLVLDIETNKINIGKFQLNPYTEKVDNLDDIFKQGFLNNYIKKGLILKEIEKGIAPPYIYELKKMNDFLREKKNVNLIFKDCEKFKCEAKIGYILSLRDGKVNLDFGYGIRYSFEKENPLKQISDLKLEDFKGIAHGKNILEVDGRIFANANKQIAITLDDRLRQKIDFLKEDIEEKYCNYRRNMYPKDNSVPYSLEKAINCIEENKVSKKEIVWYTKELEEIIHKNNLINLLEEAKKIEDIKSICMELEDNELQNIYYGMLYEEENCEDEEDEESL